MYTQKKMNAMHKEAIVRLLILGLDNKQIEEYKGNYQIPYYCGLCGGCISISKNKAQNDENWFLLEAIGEFNEYRRGIVYLAIEEQDRLFLLYLSNDTRKWKKEREELKKGNSQAFVYHRQFTELIKFQLISVVSKNRNISRRIKREEKIYHIEEKGN